MRGRQYDRILAGTRSLMLADPLAAFGRHSDELPATVDQRVPADQTSRQPSVASQAVKKEQNGATTTRAVRVQRSRSRVTVVPRSFLNAGTKMLPGERKFLDYAFPPTYAALDVVS